MTPTGRDGPAVNAMVLTSNWNAAAGVVGDALTAETRLLVVSYVRAAEQYAARLRERAEAAPAAFVVIEARDRTDDATVEGVDVRTESPRRLTGVGLQANGVLTEWHDTDAPIVVYFDAISGLLQYADLDVAYRFLHPFTAQVHEAGGRGFYRLDPDAHDDATVSTLEQLFDCFLTVDPDADAAEARPSAFL